MAVRIRADNKTILCAAMFPAEEGDMYIDDDIHYMLSVLAKVLVTDENHFEHGKWWWINDVPDNVKINIFYLEK